MTNVRSINGEAVPQLGEPNQGVIGAIEKLLEMAKSGQLQSFIGTGFTAQSERVSIWSGHHPNVHEMLGALAWLQHEFVDRVTKNIT